MPIMRQGEASDPLPFGYLIVRELFMGTKALPMWGLVAAALANCAGCAASGIPHASSSPAAQNALSQPNCFSPNLYAANRGVGWNGTSTAGVDNPSKVTQTSHTDFGPLVTVIPP